MRLRLILLVLSLLAFFSASAGGWLYHRSLKAAAFEDADHQAASRLGMIRKNISSFLSDNIRPARTLAGVEEIRKLLTRPTPESLARVNSKLDHFNSSFEAEVCYVMDRHGNTISSSNRDAPDSFVGRNFDFRPYFQSAIKGTPMSYMALGTTSKRRGVYCSHPVFNRNGNKPVGVTVIKASIERIENTLNLDGEEIVLVTDPMGIVFISSRADWLYGSLRRLSKEEMDRVAQSQQFGPGPWKWIGLSPQNSHHAIDSRGNRYLIHQRQIANYPDWQIVYLLHHNAILKRVSAPMVRTTGHVSIILCVMIGLSVAVLYRKASREITRRKAAEDALRKSQEELSCHTRSLERLVKQRTEEITSILKYTPETVWIKDIHGRYLLINPRYEELMGVKNEDIRGKTADEVMPGEIADLFRSDDRKVMEEKRACRVEYQMRRPDGKHTFLAVKFPIYDEAGRINGVGGIATDITELKKAQEQLRRLSGGILAGQENERAAIARELHDELGQMLTALRMEAVWLKKRITGNDEQAADRAAAMCTLVDKTIDDARNIALRLRPGVLDDLGLVDALEWYAGDFEKRTGITCIFEHGKVPPVTGALATASYRIAQEALTNVARHAGANCVDVKLKHENDRLTLSVSDDGNGLDTAALMESEGLGVAGMRERAAIVGGLLEVESEPGEGTRVLFEIAIQTDEDKAMDDPLTQSPIPFQGGTFD